MITPLSTPTSTTLRSSLIIPSFPQILSELVQNSLDAGAINIDIHLDLRKGCESIRVEDDGCGIEEEGLRKVGKRFRTSKTLNEAGLGAVDSYGFRGEALPSIGSLSLLSITTRTSSSSPCRTKILKSSRTVYQGIHPSRTIPALFQHGTSVSVKEIFHNIPVRRAELSKISEESLMRSCRKVIEILALSRPGVAWSLWDEKSGERRERGEAGGRKVLSIGRTKSSTDVFKALYGNALVQRVQNIRVSAGVRRVDGFISLLGDVTKCHQHLYINNYPIERGEFHLAVSKRFSSSRFATYAISGEHDDLEQFSPQYRRSPRRLERHPVYVLNVTLPSGEVDAAFEPRKASLGYKNFGALEALLLAVVEEYLKRNGYEPARASESSTPSPTKLSPQTSSHTAKSRENTTPKSLYGRSPLGKEVVSSAAIRWDLTRPPPIDFTPGVSDLRSRSKPTLIPDLHSNDNELAFEVTPAPPSAASDAPVALFQPTPPATPQSIQPTHGDIPLTSPTFNYSSIIPEHSTCKHRWITDIQKSLGTRAFPINRHRAPMKRTLDQANFDHNEDNNQGDGNEQNEPELPRPISLPVSVPSSFKREINVRLTKESLRKATLVGQVDKKYIAISLPLVQGQQSLVLIDQHAADERISAEKLLSTFCLGFKADDIPSTALSKPPMLLLTRMEAEELARPGVMDVMKRWGIFLGLPDVEPGVELEGDYIQVSVEEVPTALISRLGKKEGLEMLRLIRGYLSILSESLGEVEALIRSYDTTAQGSGQFDSWGDEEEGMGCIQEEEGKLSTEGGKEKVDRGIHDSALAESAGEGRWGKELRFMPREMLELINSKACRGAIMFEDKLDVDQCTRLVIQLADTQFPFMCAHGRPSMVPIIALESAPSGQIPMMVSNDNDREASRRMRSKRGIDWREVRKRIRGS